jgi:hypothetical protein
MLVARKTLVSCVLEVRNELTLCNLPVDSLDAACSAMAHVDEQVSNLAEEVILKCH